MYTAFGTHLPDDIKVKPPTEKYYKKWMSCERVPEKLASMATVWQGITHLKYVGNNFSIYTYNYLYNNVDEITYTYHKWPFPYQNNMSPIKFGFCVWVGQKVESENIFFIKMVSEGAVGQPVY